MLCTSLALIIILSACGVKEEIVPAAKEVFEVSTAAGFLAAAVEESGGFISGEKEAGSGAAAHAYLYDNAVALIALAEAGALWHAFKIADALVFAQTHDRVFKDGRLRNAYTSGDPKSDSGRSITGGKITIRLPGFWKDGHWREDYYTVSTSAGNMAWVLIALCKAASVSDADKKTEYLNAAIKAADFILTLKSPEGGFTGGYEGWDEEQTKVSYKSTEHNLDLVAAFRIIADAVRNEDSKRAMEYESAAAHARAFVMSMYDKKLSCFYTGTEADGKSVSEGVIPLDSNTLAILALGKELTDTDNILSFIEERMSVGGGFDFSAGDLDGIWNEGTAQMAVCYNEAGKADKYENVMKYLVTQSRKDGSMPAADRDGVSTGFFVSGSDTPWEYHNIQSIGATGWYALAQLKINPLGRQTQNNEGQKD